MGGITLNLVFAFILFCRVFGTRIGIGFFVKIRLGSDVALVRSQNVPRATEQYVISAVERRVEGEDRSQSKNHHADGYNLDKRVIRQGSWESSKRGTYRCIVHVLGCDWADCRQRENNNDEYCPNYAYPVSELSEESITHIKGSGFELNLGMVVENTAKENRDNIAQVECHRREREHSIGSDRTSKIKQAGKDADNCGQPDCPKRGHCPL